MSVLYNDVQQVSRGHPWMVCVVVFLFRYEQLSGFDGSKVQDGLVGTLQHSSCAEGKALTPNRSTTAAAAKSKRGTLR